MCWDYLGLISSHKTISPVDIFSLKQTREDNVWGPEEQVYKIKHSTMTGLQTGAVAGRYSTGVSAWKNRRQLRPFWIWAILSTPVYLCISEEILLLFVPSACWGMRNVPTRDMRNMSWIHVANSFDLWSPTLVLHQLPRQLVTDVERCFKTLSLF